LGQFLKGFPLGVSSSIIRDRIRRGFPISGLVHPKVEEDIVNCPISG
jgi:nicotinic acid mononucleotide adenylyltransferase